MLRSFVNSVARLGLRPMSTVSRIAPISIINPLASRTIFDIRSINRIEQPSVWQPNVQELEKSQETMYMDSVLRKRRLKMKKHKLRKRRREQRSLMKRLGKI